MAHQYNKDLKFLIHPYAVALKEGPNIEDDYMDYSLMLLKVTNPDIIASPGAKKSQVMHMPAYRTASTIPGENLTATLDLDLEAASES